MKTLDDLIDVIEQDLIQRLYRIRRIQLLDECISLAGGETKPLTERLRLFRLYCSMDLIAMDMIMEGRY